MKSGQCVWFWIITKETVTVKMYFITVRNRSYRKVMFSQACVKNSVRGGVHPLFRPPRTHTQTPWAHTPWVDIPPGRPLPPLDGHCSGRYASYWNAFLFITTFFYIRMLEHFCCQGWEPIPMWWNDLDFAGFLHLMKLGEIQNDLKVHL